MDIFVYINIASQTINWSITIMYFMTPIASRMANSIADDAFKKNTFQKLRESIAEYQALNKEPLEENGQRNPDVEKRLELIEKQFQHEFQQQFNLKMAVGLNMFEFSDRIKLMKLAARRMAADMASIAA